jgi:hypothetical protein
MGKQIHKGKVIGTLFLTENEFDWFGEENGWATDIIYKDETTNKTDYFYSPDGIGRIWLSLEEIVNDCYEIDENSPIVKIKNK